jgi:DNA invertase Pin-like site-specific DNA recombinase
MQIGYARTSTAEQAAGLDAQIRDLKAAGAERVYSEQVSSMAQRAELAKVLDYVRDGDVLIVTKPDRLARSTTELLAIESDLTKREVGLVVLSLGGQRLDTRNPTSKLLLTIMGGIAAWEREIMLERQREGIAKAKDEGKYKGRAPTAKRQSTEVLALAAQGLKRREIAEQLNISMPSVFRILATAKRESLTTVDELKAESLAA